MACTVIGASVRQSVAEHDGVARAWRNRQSYIWKYSLAAGEALVEIGKHRYHSLIDGPCNSIQVRSELLTRIIPQND
jgi:hypothetical protein